MGLEEGVPLASMVDVMRVQNGNHMVVLMVTIPAAHVVGVDRQEEVLAEVAAVLPTEGAAVPVGQLDPTMT